MSIINARCSLIIEIRKRHVDIGISELSKIFNHIEPIYDDRKHVRFIAKKPKLKEIKNERSSRL